MEDNSNTRLGAIHGSTCKKLLSSSLKPVKAGCGLGGKGVWGENPLEKSTTQEKSESIVSGFIWTIIVILSGTLGSEFICCKNKVMKDDMGQYECIAFKSHVCHYKSIIK